MAKKKTTKRATSKSKARKKVQKKVKRNLAKSKKSKGTPNLKLHVKRTAKSGGSAAAAIKSGDLVPDFTVRSTGGKEISLSQLKGKMIVLYFYPKDMTPGCTLEGHDFTKLYGKFAQEGAEVLGVSRDSVESHERFKEKEGYCFDLLSDESGKLTELFGVWKEKQNYGRKYMGIERSTFVIDKNGYLAREWRAVRVDGHAEEVLSSVRELNHPN